jgi:hypothetical protein
MKDILPLLQCLSPVIGTTSVRQLSRIAKAILAMEGRVTMLGISRWIPIGGSYRTVQRFFYTILPNDTMLWVFFREHLFNFDDIYLLVGDEVVVTKAGKETHGLERFFSSLYGKPVPGLSFFAWSLVSVQQRKSFPIHIEQTIKTPEEKAAALEKKQAKSQEKKSAKNYKSGPPDESSLQDKGDKALVKNKGGRPPGSKNKDKTQVTFTPELLRIKAAIARLLGCINQLFPLTYLLLDGHFRNNNALQMARQLKLHLISKLRQDSALYFPYEPSNPEQKTKAKYGPRLHIGQIPAQYLKKKTTDKNKITTEIYQATLLHKEFAQDLNVVIIVKTNQRTSSQSHVILFSSDVNLSCEKIIDYYGLRFQIEFNFRDAKQFWGLEDFMNIKETGVTNAANLSFFRVNLSHYLLKVTHSGPLCSVLDLKSQFRGYRYAEETIKLLKEKPDPVLLGQILKRLSSRSAVSINIPMKPLTIKLAKVLRDGICCNFLAVLGKNPVFFNLKGRCFRQAETVTCLLVDPTDCPGILPLLPSRSPQEVTPSFKWKSP